MPVTEINCENLFDHVFDRSSMKMANFICSRAKHLYTIVVIHEHILM